MQKAVFSMLLVVSVLAADVATAATPSTVRQRQKSFSVHREMVQKSLFTDLAFRNVGPLVMSGRVVDIEASPQAPYTFYVAYATGGLWKTVNNGVRFEPIFDDQDAISIGDIALDPQNPKVIWVGTGECNSSRSSYSGTGIYKTEDGGQTWAHKGLGDIHHTGRVLVHPNRSEVVFVAALGHLYTENKDRGIYRTTDGGQSWKKVLYVNSRTGFVDLSFDPHNPEVLYAAAWEKDRKPWEFVEGGVASGIYKTTDGGDTWQRLAGGFPRGEHVGRIGLAVSPQNSNIVYALLDNQADRPEKDQYESQPITARKLRGMSVDDILALDDLDLGEFLISYRFHADYTPKAVKEMLTKGGIAVADLAEFIGRNNPKAFDPIIVGGEVYRSDDAGQSWRKVNRDFIDRFYSTYGYYFGEIRVSPHDSNRIYIMGVPLLVSSDGGQTFEFSGGDNVHADHQAMWIDPQFPDHIIDGNDGGLNLSYDGGASWLKLNFTPVGQFYTVNVDMAEPYNIYGGLQDNGVYKGSSLSKPLKSEPWQRIGGGDGMYVQIDPDDFTVYTGLQFGYYYRLDRGTGKKKSITPHGHLADSSTRYNWQSPILLSSHSSDVLYFGANRLYRSLDRGDTWTAISPDLTHRRNIKGDVPFATITTISESKKTFGLIYAGTDDGRIHVTRNGGASWVEIGRPLPPGLWCTRIEASGERDGVVYAALNGYRNDDFRTYLYRSANYGRTWKSIRANLPNQSINVIREDPVNPHVLFVGTDRGVFVSMDQGASWDALKNGIPLVPVHDLVVHPRDHDLVVGTHGRSIYVMDVSAIEQLTPKVAEKELHLFELEEVRAERDWEKKPKSWTRPREAEPKVYEIFYWSSKKTPAKLTIEDKDGNPVRRFEEEAVRGVNTLTWDLKLDRNAVLKVRLAAAQQALEEATEKHREAQKEKKPPEELKAFEVDQTRAKADIKAIKKIVDEEKEFAHLQPDQREKRLTPIYVSEGEYTIALKIGNQQHTTTVKVLPPEDDPDLGERWSNRDEEREVETKRQELLKDYKDGKQK